jgi:hypothetical protein
VRDSGLTINSARGYQPLIELTAKRLRDAVSKRRLRLLRST